MAVNVFDPGVIWRYTVTMSTFGFINSILTPPTFRALGGLHADRWYLDFICRRDPTHHNPKLYGSFGLTGKDVTVFIISSGIKNSTHFTGRLSWLLGTPNVDVNGHGTGMAFLLGSTSHGVASRCSLVSLNVYDEGIISATLYKQAIDLILANRPANTCLVLSEAIRSPQYGRFVIDEDLDLDTVRLLDAGLAIVACAGDGLTKWSNGELVGPMLAEAVHPNHLEDVITISSISEDLTFPDFANYGYAVNGFAPGNEIAVIDQYGQMVWNSSTRSAAAIAAGILTLYLEKYHHATRQDLQAFIKDHFFTSLVDVQYPLERLQKDPFFNEEHGFLALRTSSGLPYQYLVDTQVTSLVAHAFFTKAVLETSVTHLGTVLANTQFDVPLNCVFKNLYGESKNTKYEIVSYSPVSVGSLVVGTYSGRLFGYISDVLEPVTCTIQVLLNDGLHVVKQDFTLYIQPDYTEQHTVGGVIRGRLSGVSGLNLNDINRAPLNVKTPVVPPHAIAVNLQRDVRLLDMTTGRFVSQQQTSLKSGEFLFTVPVGSYRAVVLDVEDVYTSFSIDGLKAQR